MRSISTFCILVFLFVQAFTPPVIRAQTAAAQTNSYSKQIAEIEDFIVKQMTVDKIPGLSVGFIKDDFMWAKGFGYANLENKIPAKAESVYRLASVTKPMTATAVLQLVEKGKINLDAEVQTYVPYFPRKKFPITVRQLLGHLGGISHYKNYELEGHFKDHKNTRESVAVFENFDLVAEPGTRFNYSSYGYVLLGAIIEGASGQSYADYMRENVWKPLGMNDTQMDDPTNVNPNRVRGYRQEGNQVKPSEVIDVSSRFSAGGTRATVVDLLKFGKGTIEGKTLSKTSLDLMYSSMMTKGGQFTNYGIGWFVNPTNGRFVITHNGGQTETSTTLYAFPARKLVIAMTSNLEGANVDAYAQHLFEILTGEDWNTNTYISNDRKKIPLYLGMLGVFEEGRARFEKMQKPFTENTQDLAQAFAYFNQNLNGETLQSAKQDETFRKVREGRNTSSNQSFIKIGSYIAQKLQEKYGAQRLASYSNTGAFGFFNDYIDLYGKDDGIPKEYRFNETIEKSAATWLKSWAKFSTGSSASWRLPISPESNFDELGAQLRKDFKGAEVYPNLSGSMINAIQQLALQGQFEKSLKAAQLAIDLYPELDLPNSYYGIILVLSGDKEKGKQFLKHAAEINGNGLASANGLNQLASDIAGSRIENGGLAILQTAVELYPNNANLFYSLGEFYLRKEMKEKAVEAYKKALEINPNFQGAENARLMLKKLENQ